MLLAFMRLWIANNLLNFLGSITFQTLVIISTGTHLYTFYFTALHYPVVSLSGSRSVSYGTCLFPSFRPLF